MNDNKKTKSISRKINRHSVLELVSSFILLDILIFLFLSLSWCWDAERSSGEGFDITRDRCFVSTDTIPEDKLDPAFLAERGNTVSLVFPKGFSELLEDSAYVFESSDGESVYTYSGGFLTSLFSMMYLVLALEIIIILCNAVTGARKIRKSLAPLDELAFKTSVLGTADFDAQAFEELERAINDISPTKEGARLNTGNAEMEHLEESINALIDRMRESYRQQARFVSDASHELRTPLAVLQGYVDMLARWGKNDEKILDESIEAIKSETEHMKRLVEQLLFLARGDSGRTKLKMEKFSLRDMMREVYDESVMIDKDHRYEFRSTADPVNVTGDISMLKQTARILTDNAAKYAPKDSCIILEASSDGCGKSSFMIQDEGIGIDDTDIPHVFERFFRSDPARARESGGTGLGLSIAKWIVDRHGGYFKVLSRKDIGTRITVILPEDHT